MAVPAVVGNIRMTGNEIKYMVGGAAQDSSLTFLSDGIVTTGYLKADYFEGTYKSGEIQDFVGSAITLTKDHSAVSTYGNQVAVAGDNEIAVKNDINVETTARSGADSSLQTRLSIDELARSSADNSLQTRLSNEEDARSGADSSIQTRFSGNVSSLQTRLSNEEDTRSAADSSLQTRLSVEEQRFTDTFAGTITQTTLKLSSDCEAVAFVTTSDARLKKDVEPVVGAVELVSRINPVFYNWIDGRSTINPGHKELGFLAQELEAVLPNVVKTTEEGGEISGMKRVAYDRLVSLLVAAVKELKGEIEAMKHA